jgi:hypothetical protein
LETRGIFIHLFRSWRSVICDVSSVSAGGVGGMGSAIEAVEMWAGRDKRETVAECGFGKSTKDVGPLYVTGLVEREAARNDRYCPTLGI